MRPAPILILCLAGCATAPHTPAPSPASETGHVHAAMVLPAGVTTADVEFVQHMIAHHSQALIMAAMVAERTSRPEMQSLAERIRVSQESEIALMRRWLQRRNIAFDSAGQHSGAHAATMPGMLTADELTKLRASSGLEFERLFLESMTRHHEGAITMVRDLFKTPGGGQEGELFIFASDVDADQRAEIARMKALLAKL